MSLKYKCPECGEPLGYEGLCWKCRARHHRKAVESWTDEELEEKINQVVERLKNLEDKEFYQTDECDTFYDLMTRGINIEKISEVACENEIYYPSELYYKANEKIRDRLRARILDAQSSSEGAELLGCLAMIGDKVAQDTLYELKIYPREWRKQLYVDSDVYAEEGGWTFDSKNSYIKLNYDKCFAFELGEKKGEGTFIGRRRGEKCPHCGSDMVDILVIDGRDERFSFLGLDGIITASCCPNCVVMSEGMSNRFTLDGKSEILEFDGEEESYLSDEDIDKLVDNRLILAPKEKSVFYGAFGDDINTIGGFGSWVQDWEYRECPECHRKMKYLAQVHWGTLDTYAEGTLYIEICPDCKIITMFHQQT